LVCKSIRQSIECYCALRAGPKFGNKLKVKSLILAGVGTGGTISGVGKYLKEKNPDIKIWGIDTYGSVFKNTMRLEFLMKMRFILI
jgi:cysteine synthase